MFQVAKTFLLLLAILISISSCKNKQPSNGESLTGTSWILISMPGELPDEVAITLIFEEERMSGKGVCNRYFSDYKTDGHQLTFGNIGATEMGCLEHADVESKYFSLIGQSSSYRIENDRLRIQTPEGTLVFAKGKPEEESQGMSEVRKPSISGEYVTDGYPDEYWQKLSITPDNGGFQVEFTASEVRGKPACSFRGTGTLNRDTLVVPVGQDDDAASMIIWHNKDTLNVFTRRFDNRFALMQYCSGGASLAGAYFRSK